MAPSAVHFMTLVSKPIGLHLKAPNLGKEFKRFNARFNNVLAMANPDNIIKPAQKIAAQKLNLTKDAQDILDDVKFKDSEDKNDRDLCTTKIIAYLTRSKGSKYLHRFRFHRLKQEQGEKVKKFTKRLKAAATTTEWKTDAMNDNLINQLIYGLSETLIRTALLDLKADTFSNFRSFFLFHFLLNV